MASVILEQVSKRFGSRQVLEGISLQIQHGELLSVLGPSGSGKSTLLRLIAGLEAPDEGRILIDGQVVCDHGRWVPPQRRGVGMVFQSYALWPHMNAFQNVAFPLEVSGLPRAEVARRTREVLAMVELTGFEEKRPGQMSGGEQQRVALARALVGRPAILLMDESLSNLDARLREKMATELRQIQQAAGVTTAYVTHDQHEAFVLSDRMAVLQVGKIQQVGRPGELYSRPRNPLVAATLGAINLLTQEQARELGLPVPELRSAGNILGIRPDRVLVSWQAPGAGPAPGDARWIPAQVTRAVHLEDGWDCWARVSTPHVRGSTVELQLRAREGDGRREAIPSPGEPVWLTAEPRDWIIME